ncbi:hypothetical protein ACIQUM_05440 [Amycolatopsis azurea]|uniref:hypothetical protein n=1 Tax=Amycolatopsis azurea TaxID=36819 RepID=UPI0038110C5B
MQTEMDAVIVLEIYGSPWARELLRRWNVATADDEAEMQTQRDAMIDLARRELGTHLLGTTPDEGL